MKNYEQPEMQIVSLTMQEVLLLSSGETPDWQDDPFGVSLTEVRYE
jgi:hypothetical protein